MAATNFSGQATLKMSVIAWGLATLGNKLLRFNTLVEKRVVECIDLDSFVEAYHIEKVHFMKIDTEGSELNILRGAQNMIQRDHPIIIMEYSWQLISSEDILCIPIKEAQ